MPVIPVVVLSSVRCPIRPLGQAGGGPQVRNLGSYDRDCPGYALTTEIITVFCSCEQTWLRVSEKACAKGVEVRGVMFQLQGSKVSDAR